MRDRIIRYALPLTILVCALLAPTGAAAQPAKAYQSPIRDKCEAELAKDKAWAAELRNDMRPAVHQEDANIIAKNKKHVVMAYAALWGLTVVFVVLMWLRQRRLQAEMERLAKQIAKAAAE
jgi:hypothetical protein